MYIYKRTVVHFASYLHLTNTYDFHQFSHTQLTCCHRKIVFFHNCHYFDLISKKSVAILLTLLTKH